MDNLFQKYLKWSLESNTFVFSRCLVNYLPKANLIAQQIGVKLVWLELDAVIIGFQSVAKFLTPTVVVKWLRLEYQ